MAYFLVALTLYTFVLRSLGLSDTALYAVANPYVLLMPFIFIWQGSVILVGKPVDRNAMIGWLVIMLFPCMMLRTGTPTAEFSGIFLKGVQFFFGPVLLVPAILGFFRMANFVEPTDDTAKRYIVILSIIAASVTLIEFIGVHIIGLPPQIFPWVGDIGAGAKMAHDTRPWGITSYPQPNALILAYLFWLAVLYGTKGTFHKAASCTSVLAAASGTGLLALVGMVPIGTKRPFALLTLILSPAIVLSIWATATSQYYRTGGLLGRFDIAYYTKPIRFLTMFIGRFLDQFSTNEVLFGTQSPDKLVVLGLTHDWAYLDVFYAYGLFGVLGYILLYSSLLFLAVPPSAGTSKRLLFAAAGLALNFHYGTLNYFVGQFMFGALAALQLNRMHSRALSSAIVPVSSYK